MSVVIVDGISASGKTMFIKSVQETLYKECPNYSKLILTEHLTERFFEGKIIKTEDVTKHVLKILEAVALIKSFKEGGRFSDNEKILNIYIERLFLTLMSRGLLDISFFKKNSRLIERLQIKSILLYIPEELILHRLQNTLSHRNERWKNFLLSFGSLEKASLHFLKQQKKMHSLQRKLSPYIETEIIEFIYYKKTSGQKPLQEAV